MFLQQYGDAHLDGTACMEMCALWPKSFLLLVAVGLLSFAKKMSICEYICEVLGVPSMALQNAP